MIVQLFQSRSKAPSRMLFIVALFALSSCMQQMQVARFDVPHSDQPILTVQRTLLALGHSVESLDGAAGVAVTAWQNMGIPFGQIDGQNAMFHRRFTVTFQPTDASIWVTVRADSQRCIAVTHSSTVTSNEQAPSGVQIQGRGYGFSYGNPGGSSQQVTTHRAEHCEHIEGIREEDQRELWNIGDSLARDLRSAQPSARATPTYAPPPVGGDRPPDSAPSAESDGPPVAEPSPAYPTP